MPSHQRTEDSTIAKEVAKDMVARARAIDQKIVEAEKYPRGTDLLGKSFELIRSEIKATKIGDSLVATIRLNGEDRFAFLNPKESGGIFHTV